jgi:nicotinate-nucleotide adenylyltransferase
MRIGLFGGTFNPFHCGHLKAALEIKKAFSLDKNYIIPSATPPHKNSIGLVGAVDRLEMIRQAVSDYPDLVVSDIELKREGPSYTIDTVNHFKSRFSGETRLYLIVGLDAFLEIDTWKSYNDLLRTIPFIVMARPDPKWGDVSNPQQVLERFLKRRISKDYTFSSSRSGYFHTEKQPIFIAKANLLDISSSIIRELIKAGGSIRSLVPRNVERYIKSKGLYR